MKSGLGSSSSLENGRLGDGRKYLKWRREWDSIRRSRESLAAQGKALGANDYGPPSVSLEFSPVRVFFGGALADFLPIWAEQGRGGHSHLNATSRPRSLKLPN